MFKKRLEFDVKPNDLVKLMRAIGKYGLKFRIGKLNYIVDLSAGKRLHFYHVSIYATRHELKKLQNDIKNAYEYWFD